MVHTLIIADTCQLGICLLTFISFSWSTDFVEFTSFSCFGQYLNCHTIEAHNIWLTRWLQRLHVSHLCVTRQWPHFHGLLTVKFVSSFHDYVTFSLAIQAVMGSPYFGSCILDGGYMCIFMHVYFTYLVWLKGKPKWIYLWQKTANCLHINA